MTQLAPDEPKISALKVSSQGQVTLSKEARQQHQLNAGVTVLEISLPGCIVLLPQSEVMADLMFRAHSGLEKLGLSVASLKERVAKRSQDNLNERYPGVFDE